MSSPANIPMAERSDIHKSCKSIEILLNILNEYCEVAGAVVVLQKKLAKALREMAGLKITGEISANALHTSATIFEALSDIDSKFAKVVDKEYDDISNDVKKWFKKLGREEKAHDERILNANARIKQAGLTYEKKSKKKASDVQEEHARYINLISTLSPEISQETQNHALNVSRRHTTTTYIVAACLSRVADAEWQRSCESIRRFSPTVGPLGEWRALCEGGWSGSIPLGLPNLDTSATPQPQSMPQAVKSIEEDTPRISPLEEIGARAPEFRESAELLPPGYLASPLAQHSRIDPPSRDYNNPASGSLTIPRQNPHNVANSEGQADFTPASLELPRPPFVDPNTGSVRSLSAFPPPPTHFPLPPPRQQLQQSDHSSTSNLNLPSQLMDSPLSANHDRPGPSEIEESDQREHQQHTRSSPLASLSPKRTPERPRMQGREPDSLLPAMISSNDLKQSTTIPSQITMPTDIRQGTFENLPLHEVRHGSSSSGDTRPSTTRPHSQGGYRDNGHKFGMDYNAGGLENPRPSDGSRYPPPLEGADAGSSLVATGSRSPPPRNLPRLPLSVNSLASRYQLPDTPLLPKPKPTLPSRQQSLPPVDTLLHRSQEPVYQDHLSISPRGHFALSNSEDDHRQQGDDELMVSGGRREQQLRERERELEVRSQELERDRLRLISMRENDEIDGRDHSVLRPRERRISLRHQLERRLSQMDLGNLPEVAPLGSAATANPKSNSRSQYSYNTPNLIPPSSPGINTPPATIHSVPSPRYGQNSQPSSSPQRSRLETQYEQREPRRFPGNSNEDTETSTHGPYCSCESCSVTKHKFSSGPPPNYRQPVPLKPQDKSKSGTSWIRRLSMPVGNAFNLDSKRHQSNNSSVSSTTSNYGVGSGIGSGPIQSGGGRGIFSMDARKNVSTTALRTVGEGGDHNVQEDGRLGVRGSRAVGVGRRSYEAVGLRSGSVTNLGITAGRR